MVEEVLWNLKKKKIKTSKKEFVFSKVAPSKTEFTFFSKFLLEV